VSTRSRTILIVDQDEAAREALGTPLRRDHRVLRAGSGEAALAILMREELDVALLDVEQPGISGFELLRILRENYPAVEVIMISAAGRVDDAVRAVKEGAFHFVAKHSEPEAVRSLVEHALERQQLNREVLRLRTEVDESTDREFVAGPSPATRGILDLVGRVAGLSATVLILGESGTGKELLARLLHRQSARPEGPFVAVNLAAIPRELVESLLFGYEKGSFTGAMRQQIGKFELASGGTLFLDEIGEMPLELQAKLLRVLQEREIDRVGGTRPLPVDVRIVAATNADLARSVEEGRFRRDLYYRLAVVPIRLPPLREREGDVVLLARHFLAKYGEQLKGRPLGLAKDAEPLLQSHGWPGNVRELQNVIQRALLKLAGTRVAAKDLVGLLPIATSQERGVSGLVESLLDGAPPDGGRYQAALAAVEAPLIAAALARTSGNQLRAAELLGMNRNTLRERMRALGMKPRSE